MINDSIWVTATLEENPCLHITDSHVIKTKSGIMEALEFIHTTQMYKDLQGAGYNRTINSEYQEWAAHNVLYRLGIFRKRTGSTDIDQNEPTWRKVVYAVLSIFVG